MIRYKELEVLLDYYANDHASVLEIGSNGLPGYLDNRNDLSVLRTNVKKLPGIDQIVNAEHLPFLDESFDLVFMIATDYYVPNIEQMFSDIYRVLRYDGYLINATYKKTNLNWQVRTQVSAVHAKSWEEYRQIYESLGFSADQKRVLNNPPSNAIKRLIWKMSPKSLLYKKTQWRIHVCKK